MRYAIIDIGSNTVKMTLYDETVIRQKYSQSVYLLSYVENGILNPAGIEALCRVLATYRSVALREKARLFAYATASLRGLSNQDTILDTVKTLLSIDVDVISGEEEAYLSLRGIAVASGIDTDGKPFFDLGGGSLEVALPTPSGLLAHSFALGALKTYLGFIKNVLPTENELLAIYRYAKERFEEAALIPPKVDASLAVGGTLRAVCTLLASERGEGYDENKPFTVTREDAVSLLQKIVSLDRKTKLTMLEKIPQRIHTVAPGLSVFLALLDTLSLTAFTVVSGGVREGYLEKIIKKEDGI